MRLENAYYDKVQIKSSKKCMRKLNFIMLKNLNFIIMENLGDFRKNDKTSISFILFK